MKNSSVMLSVLAGIVIAALSLAGCTSGKANGEVGSGEAVKTNGTGTKIVYINTDTLMSNYLLAIELNEAFWKKQEERRTELNIKAKSLDQETNEFQRKLQNNGFLSEARAVDARDQLLIKQENLRRLQQDMMDKTAREQNELNKQLYDKLTSFLKEYNKEKGFDIVLSTQVGSTVLYAVDGFDITNDVVKGLNEEYKKNNGK
ncbi:OmpH family outer membrane protein [Odoribacter sp. Z80]|uniref:OmpH family outer membrane protein n=1 Tax=Odoribacter sp. Z80 TaxID=2304575 RepID=UPI00137B8920|nr:OmpH family outer membrane protein [Odoribacter sp. Z80]NCE71775.1 OmpH family outer membrane protein [Odoribacter sp. Z80]